VANTITLKLRKLLQKTLEMVEAQEDINQTPRTFLEEQRFVYFYKDSVTELYNAKYLEANANEQ